MYKKIKTTEPKISYEYLRLKTDGTFIIKLNGYPFHVTPDYPPAEMYGEDFTFEKLNKYAETHPDEVTDYIESELPLPSEETLKQSRLTELESESQRLIPYIQAGIDAAVYQQKLIDILLEIEELKGNLE